VPDEAGKEEMVPKKALLEVQKKYQKERDARGQSERLLNDINARLAQMEAAQQPAEQRDDYDPITYGEFKQLTAKQQAQMAHQMQLQTINQSRERAKMKYQNADLSFDDAYEIFRTSSDITDTQRQNVTLSADPGEEMYQLVLLKQAKTGTVKQAKDVADKMNQNVNQAKTLSDASKADSKTLNKLKELQKMTPKEISQRLDEIARQKLDGG
jgi:hypothetical protein